MNDISVVFILGPTASGKTNLAIRAAQTLGAEIINADSIQVYKSLDIGSAKPSRHELTLVPHHLIGHLDEGDNYTAGRFRKDVLDTIEKRSKAGVRRFFIVGGSGFYIKALLYGLYEIPEIPEKIQAKIKTEDPKVLYEELKKVDPVAANKINPNDTYRVSRAVEVFRATGTPISSYQEAFEKNPNNKFPYKYLKIGLRAEKDILKQRVVLRTERMLAAGLISEVKNLLSKGLENWDALASVGYKEVVMFLKGHLSEDQLAPEIVKNTMALIKRQMTWFKKDDDMTWFDVSEENEKIIQFISERL